LPLFGAVVVFAKVDEALTGWFNAAFNTFKTSSGIRGLVI
jgi:hypothetical protein